MRIREQEVLIPTSMVGNYPNPRWWDASWARHFHGDREPPDSMNCEAFEDAIGRCRPATRSTRASTSSRTAASTATITPTQAVYYYLRRMGYDLRGGSSRVSRFTVVCTRARSSRRSSGTAR